MKLSQPRTWGIYRGDQFSSWHINVGLTHAYFGLPGGWHFGGQSYVTKSIRQNYRKFEGRSVVPQMLKPSAHYMAAPEGWLVQLGALGVGFTFGREKAAAS